MSLLSLPPEVIRQLVEDNFRFSVEQYQVESRRTSRQPKESLCHVLLQLSTTDRSLSEIAQEELLHTIVVDGLHRFHKLIEVLETSSRLSDYAKRTTGIVLKDTRNDMITNDEAMHCLAAQCCNAQELHLSRVYSPVSISTISEHCFHHRVKPTC